VNGPSGGGTGVAFTFTVTALDASSNVAADYSGTVHFTSSDARALLPADSTLVRGTGTFSASLTAIGTQTITATDTASPSLRASFSITAVAAQFPVTSFGAKGDGSTDDTAAIQRAINAAGSAGGGTVVFGVTRYYTTGNLVVPTGVVLSGAAEGSFFVSGQNPALITVAPTLLVTNTSGPFLTLQGVGAGVTDLLFHYPKQVPATAAAPRVYPYTILVTAPGTKVVRSLVTNAYNFLDIEAGRVLARDLIIGAYHIGINVDHALDRVTVDNIFYRPEFDAFGDANFPAPIDAYVTNNLIALKAGHVNGLQVSSLFTIEGYIGMLLTDSSDTSQGTLSGYGAGSDFDLEGVQYGIVATASQSPGYKFTNVAVQAACLAPPCVGQAAVQVRAGGSMPPKIQINSASVIDDWALGKFPPPPAGTEMVIVDVLP
jgi:hypothetical protein